MVWSYVNKISINKVPIYIKKDSKDIEKVVVPKKIVKVN